ncbi:MAG: PEGA domain-containing protein [bacterium]|nr:PEGA domain-containing protein [bacterium]
MPLWLRRTIYVSFMAVFFIVAPLLALYSMGYRYHPGKHRLERTGLIVVDGGPSDAVVLVDGEVRATRLPARVGGLGENVYTLRVMRDGYHPWEQRVAVVSGETTFATDVHLFRDASPSLLVRGTITTYTASADARFGAAIRADAGFEELWIHDLKDGTRTLVLRTPQDARRAMEVIWSPRDARLLVRTATDVLVIDPRAPHEPLALARILDAAPDTAQWELGSGDAVIATTAGRIFRISVDSGRAIPLPIAIPETPFAVSRDALYTTVRTAHGNTLQRIPTNGDPTTTVATLATDLALTRFLDLRGTTITVETDAPRRTVTVNTTTGTITVREGFDFRRSPYDATAARWFTETFELWTEEHDPPTERLLVRRDAPLVDALWLPGTSSLIVATAKDVHALARDSAGEASTTPLAAFDGIRGITVQQDGSTLFIAGERDGASGLWELPLSGPRR